MKAQFSPSLLSFYPQNMIDDESYENLPDDLLEVTDEELLTFWEKPAPEGKQLGAIEGRPAWVAIPVIIESLPVRLSKLSTIYKADISALNESYLSALVNDGINETAKLQVVRDQIVERKAQYIADIAAAKAAHK
jgi:hypothetical protein